ncbi:hypothetical protein GCM10009804_06720 [Kribbella hippodromi]|uniref:DUF3592 domain-containing protein n=1 Tax=Kribbella hippodromi TaxID=434347 RepID=A0ABN2C4R1_9ACTN
MAGSAVWAAVCMLVLPLGIAVTVLDQQEDSRLADGPVVPGVVVDEPVPIVDRGQPLRVAFTTSRGQRVELNIEKYLEPRRRKGQSINIQYAYAGSEVLAREAGWQPDFWSRYFILCLGIAGALAGTSILIISVRRTVPAT